MFNNKRWQIAHYFLAQQSD
uniref:Uncharacterized protein n=1 Tax=Arundo donax TaxID=35708 RepID=A0A0A9AW79_ARUDO